MRDRDLTQEIGRLLREEREKADLTQQVFAARAGVTQQWLSRVERGVTAPTTAAVQRLFAALDLRLRPALGPLDADLDEQIDRLAAASDADRLAALDDHFHVCRKLSGVPYVLSGRLAAFLQGAPIPAARLDVAVAEADLDQLAVVLAGLGGARWNERWREFLDHSSDPRRPGPRRWRIGGTELAVEVTPEPPASLTVRIGERTLRVRPLVELERTDPELGELMARVRRRVPTTQP